MAQVQAYTKFGVDAKFDSRSNMTLVHGGGGTPDISAYPDSKTGDVIERSSDGARWSVVASTLSPIAGRVVSVSGKTGVVTLGPGDIGAAPASHTHTKAQITDLNASTEAISNSVAQRGSGGVLVVGSPTATTHATTRAYVDNAVSAGKAWTAIIGKPSTFTPSSHTHTMSNITDLPEVSNSIVANGIVRRYSTGQIAVPSIPDAAQSAVSKGYVDSKLSVSTISTENLDDMLTSGHYFQPLTANATTDKNYPAGARAGHLFVVQGSIYTKQEYTDYQGKGLYYRTMNAGVWYPWYSISQSAV